MYTISFQHSRSINTFFRNTPSESGLDREEATKDISREKMRADQTTISDFQELIADNALTILTKIKSLPNHERHDAENAYYAILAIRKRQEAIQNNTRSALSSLLNEVQSA